MEINVSADRWSMLSNIQKKYATKQWLTDNIVNEIDEYLPTANDIDDKNNNQRCNARFSVNFSKLFPVGRLFLNKIQLKQSLQKFCEAWAVKITTDGQTFWCFYHEKKEMY